MIKMVIATPLYGPPSSATVAYGYHQSVLALARDPAVDYIAGHYLSNDDLVRSRSRAVRMFLERPDTTHLLFWDADVVPRDLHCIRAMIETGKDVIALPYPRKVIDWEAVAAGVRDEAEQDSHGRQSGHELEQLGMRYPIHTGACPTFEGSVGTVDAIGTGFMLVSRAALQQMTDHYRPSLEFDDEVDGQLFPTVAIFQLLLDGRTLLHEDYSFCARWRALGGTVHVWLDPASHIGGHAFRGHVSGLLRG